MQDRFWEIDTQYNPGDVVVYQDRRYENIQGHRSQADWDPSKTPALWRQTDYQGGCCHQQAQCDQQCDPCEKPQRPQYSQQTAQYSDDQKTEPAPDSEHPKHWYGDESNKKKLEIGGGIAAGAALLAGGLFAYKKHEQHKEEGKARVWARNNWLEEARDRTKAFYNQGPQGPAVWILTQGKTIPNGAIAAGEEHGHKLYSSRAFHEGALVVGKASLEFEKGCLIGYGDNEIAVDEYEVLVGDTNRLKWVSASGRLRVANLGYRPVEGGRERDETPLYIARGPYKGATHPGKVSEKLDGAYITYGGSEEVIKEYQVLCYN